MTFYLIFIGLPSAVYLLLCLLPRGRLGWLAETVGVLGAVALFLKYRAEGDPWGQMLAGFFAVAVVLAILPRILRPALSQAGYLALVFGLMVAVLVLAWFGLGL